MEIACGNVNMSNCDVELLYETLRHHGAPAIFQLVKKYGTNQRIMGTLSSVLQTILEKSDLQNNNKSLPSIIRKFYKMMAHLHATMYRKGFDRPNFTSSENTFIPTLPLEKYLDVPQNERLTLFFKSFELYDILVGRVTAHNPPCYILSLLCFANGKCRQIDDLDFRVHLPCDKVSGDVKVNDFIKVTIVGSAIKERRIFVSADDADLPEDFNGGASSKLGLITEDEFPNHYKYLLERGDEPYNNFVDDQQLLAPHRLEKMLGAFNFNITDVPSLTTSGFQKSYEPEEYGSFIKVKQIQALTEMHIKKGQSFVLVKKYVDAVVCFNKAIELDANNIPALFELGTAYMQLKNYEKSEKMLEKVLELQPNYEQAQQFLSKATLDHAKAAINLGENEAIYKFECCEKALKYNPNDLDIQKAMSKLLYNGLLTTTVQPYDEIDQTICSQKKKKSHEDENSGSDMEVEQTEENRIEVVPVQPVPPPTAAINPLSRSNMQEEDHALRCTEFVKRMKLEATDADKRESKFDRHERRKCHRSKHRHRSSKKKKHKRPRSPGDKGTSLDDISSDTDDDLFLPAKDESSDRFPSPQQKRSLSPLRQTSLSPSRQRSATPQQEPPLSSRLERSPKPESKQRSPVATHAESRSFSPDRYRSKYRRRSDSSSSDSRGYRRHRRSRSPRQYRRTRRRSRSTSRARYRHKATRTRSPSMEWRSVSPRRPRERRKSSADRLQPRRFDKSPTPDSLTKRPEKPSSHPERSSSEESPSAVHVLDDSPESTTSNLLNEEHFRHSSYLSTNKRPAINIINNILKSNES